MTGAEIAATLARLRKEHGLSQADLGELAGFTTRGTVSRWERGHYPHALDQAAEWAQACGHELVIVPREKAAGHG